MLAHVFWEYKVDARENKESIHIRNRDEKIYHRNSYNTDLHSESDSECILV